MLCCQGIYLSFETIHVNKLVLNYCKLCILIWLCLEKLFDQKTIYVIVSMPLECPCNLGPELIYKYVFVI